MSKYTSMDADVVYLDTSDRVNYEFDLLKHNVDSAVELSWGIEGLRNPRGLRDKFKNWKTVGLAIITLLVFILTIALIIVTIIYIYVYIRKIEWKRKLLHQISVSMILFFAVLMILFYLFNKMLGEMTSLIALSKEPNE